MIKQMGVRAFQGFAGTGLFVAMMVMASLVDAREVTVRACGELVNGVPHLTGTKLDDRGYTDITITAVDTGEVIGRLKLARTDAGAVSFSTPISRLVPSEGRWGHEDPADDDPERNFAAFPLCPTQESTTTWLPSTTTTTIPTTETTAPSSTTSSTSPPDVTTTVVTSSTTIPPVTETSSPPPSSTGPTTSTSTPPSTSSSSTQPPVSTSPSTTPEPSPPQELPRTGSTLVLAVVGMVLIGGGGALVLLTRGEPDAV